MASDDRWEGAMKALAQSEREDMARERDALALQVEALRARVAELERDGSPGVLHAVDRAFYNLTVRERDVAHTLLDRLEREMSEVKKELRQMQDMRVERDAANADAARLREALGRMVADCDSLALVTGATEMPAEPGSSLSVARAALASDPSAVDDGLPDTAHMNGVVVAKAVGT